MNEIQRKQIPCMLHSTLNYTNRISSKSRNLQINKTPSILNLHQYTFFSCLASQSYHELIIITSSRVINSIKKRADQEPHAQCINNLNGCLVGKVVGPITGPLDHHPYFLFATAR